MSYEYLIDNLIRLSVKRYIAVIKHINKKDYKICKKSEK